MNIRFLPIALAVGLLLLAGCQPATTAPTPTSTVTHTPLPPPSATVTASATSAPAATAIAPPVVPLSQTGPWLAIHDNYSIWAANSDGTGLTELSNNYNYSNRLTVAVAPLGGQLAFFSPAFMPDQMVGNPPELMLVTLPSTSLKLLTPLHSGIPFNGTNFDYLLDGELWAVLTWESNLDWSPDGSMLAFVGAQDGPSSDLYIYSTKTDLVKRLTSDPTQALDPSWAPDGSIIISLGIKDMHYATGGSNGPAIDKIWAIRPDGSDLRVVHSFPEDDLNPPFLHLVSWVNKRTYLEAYSALGCGDYNLTMVDILNPSLKTILPGVFNSAALDPESGTVLVMVPKIPDEYAYVEEMCGNTTGPGLFLISLFGTGTTQIIPFDLPAEPDGVDHVLSWSSTAQLFFVFNNDGIFTVDLQGQISSVDIPTTYSIYTTRDLNNLPIVSPNGQEWAFFNLSREGLWIASHAHPTLEIFHGRIEDALWMPYGSTILFISEEMLYRAAGPDYEVTQLGGPLLRLAGAYEIYMDWVMP
jgi:hypothetical protein